MSPCGGGDKDSMRVEGDFFSTILRKDAKFQSEETTCSPNIRLDFSFGYAVVRLARELRSNLHMIPICKFMAKH